MTNDQLMRGLLEPYEPQRPLEQLVLEVNQIYHSIEAQDYDATHPEISVQLPPLWRKMLWRTTGEHPDTSWRILNFGCGTGFEAEQLLSNLPRESIELLVCYDPSPEMLDRCRAKISPLFSKAVFCTGCEGIQSGGAHFNMLATNSLLHHLPNPGATINNLLPLLAPNAIWLAGHEPSSRFYFNSECRSVYESFLREQRIKKLVSLGTYLGRLQLAAGLRRDPAGQTAREAHRRGLFRRVPPRMVVSRLVDFHVAHSREEAASGRGLDFERMQQEFSGVWCLSWVKSYAFMGPFYEGALPLNWGRRCAKLRSAYPNDGANFCSIWTRV